ncbi:AraC family transcriptional regulator [Sphingobacterium sp. Mn56C]|uniref:AraC family transcriptional regulator n=1 Tax=Sphingobacterium sp. Mn56C TaxID=3395261 RepID=UPI003BBF2681
MKLKQLTLNHNAIYQSFQVRRDEYPLNHNSWHCHEHLEFIYIYKGSGTLFIGDCIQPFMAGDSVLIGANMPHYWLFDEVHNSDNALPIDCIVIHFKKDFAGKDFFFLPELKQLKDLIQKAEKGLFHKNHKGAKLAMLFQELLASNSTHRLLYLLQALHNFSSLAVKQLVSANYSALNSNTDEQRMNDIMEYIRNNYKMKIELDKLAKQAKMTKNSFCRYFKQRTGKTLIEFVSEIRISNACRQLKYSDMSIKEVCFDCGFNNFVSFHRMFKKQIGTTPVQFRNSIPLLKNNH